MLFWRDNYGKFFSDVEFDKVLGFLKTKEKEDRGERLKEIDNWLSLLS